MSDLTDLPDWVWTLLDAIEEYEDVHPLLYRLDGNATDGALEYSREPCFGTFLSDAKAWPPDEALRFAEFRRQLLARERGK